MPEQHALFKDQELLSARDIKVRYGVKKRLASRLYTLEEAEKIIEDYRNQPARSSRSGPVNPCAGCPLQGRARVPNEGSFETARVVFVGEAPGAIEEEEGVPFVGRAGELLNEVLKEVGIDRNSDEVCITNVCQCRPDNNVTPSSVMIRHCSKYLKSTLKEFKGLVVLLGGVALQSVFGKVSVMNRRGYGFIRDGVQYFATLHPAYILRNSNYRSEFQKDLRKVAVWMDNDFELSYEVLETKEGIEAFVSDSIAKKTCLAFDIETTGLDPFGELATVLSVSFSAGRDETYFLDLRRDDNEELMDALAPIFTSPDICLIGQNGKFDINWIRVCYGIECSNYWYDTKLAHFMWKGKYLPSRLKEMAWKYTDYGGYDVDVDVVKLVMASSEELGNYNAMDALVTFDLAMYFLGQLSEKQNSLLTEIICPAVPAFSEMEMVGLFLDKDNLNNFASKKLKEIARLETKLHSYPEVVELEQKEQKLVNFGSPDQLVAVLKAINAVPEQVTAKKGRVSTDEKALKTVQHKHPLVKDLLALRHENKLYGTYLSPYQNKWPERGLVHGDYDFDRTATGRTSCRKPNLQNIPYSMRPIFRSRYDYLVEADYSQLELRVLASLSGDETLVADFEAGKDVHESTRFSLFGDNSHLSDIEQESQRVEAKSVNFGVVYGITEHGLSKGLKNKGHKVSKEQAARWINAFYRRYPGVERWHSEVKKSVVDVGYIETVFGRRRSLNFKRAGIDDKARHRMFRQAINTPVQSAASDIVVNSAKKMWRAMRALNMESKLVAYVHDSLILDVVDSELDQLVYFMKTIMQESDFDWLTVPLVVDIKLGTHWGTLEKV